MHSLDKPLKPWPRYSTVHDRIIPNGTKVFFHTDRVVSGVVTAHLEDNGFHWHRVSYMDANGVPVNDLVLVWLYKYQAVAEFRAFKRVMDAFVVNHPASDYLPGVTVPPIPKCRACGCDAISCASAKSHSRRVHAANRSAIRRWRKSKIQTNTP